MDGTCVGGAGGGSRMTEDVGRSLRRRDGCSDVRMTSRVRGAPGGTGHGRGRSGTDAALATGHGAILGQEVVYVVLLAGVDRIRR